MRTVARRLLGPDPAIQLRDVRKLSTLAGWGRPLLEVAPSEPEWEAPRFPSEDPPLPPRTEPVAEPAVAGTDGSEATGFLLPGTDGSEPVTCAGVGADLVGTLGTVGDAGVLGTAGSVVVGAGFRGAGLAGTGRRGTVGTRTGTLGVETVVLVPGTGTLSARA